MNIRSVRKIEKLTVILTFCMSMGASQANFPSDCAERKQQSNVTITAAKTKSSIEQFYTYLRFLNLIGEDLEDCVTSDMRAEISCVEENLVVLEAEGQVYRPENILHCNEVEPRTQACKGPDLDDTLLIRETKESSFSTLLSLPHSGMVSVKLPAEFKAKVLGVFAGDRSELQNGKQPSPILLHAEKFSIQELRKWKNPALIVIWHRDDLLQFRKCVWLF